MTCRELLEKCAKQNRELLARAERAQASLDDKKWNEAPQGGWSPAQIFEHMTLANAPYIETLERVLPNAKKGDESQEKYSWFGRLIHKVSSPQGNAPAPKNLHPKPGLYSREVFARWRKQQEQIIALHEKAKGIDLAGVRAPNPFVKLFRMTLCDFFAILATHTERHVGQIESRVK